MFLEAGKFIQESGYVNVIQSQDQNGEVTTFGFGFAIITPEEVNQLDSIIYRIFGVLTSEEQETVRKIFRQPAPKNVTDEKE
jgi:hypothetical protein